MSAASDRVCGSVTSLACVLQSTTLALTELSAYAEPSKVALLVPQASCIQLIGRHKKLWHISITLTGLLVPGGDGLVQWSCSVLHLGAGTFCVTRYDGSIEGIIEETMAQLPKE